MTEGVIEPFARAHLDALIALVSAEGWAEYSDDVQRTYRALTAPGATTLVAIADGRVAGVIQVQSDGVIQAHVSMLLIDRKWRGAGLGTRLLREGLERAGGLRLDIRTRTEGYYERLGASRSVGFRLTREDLCADPDSSPAAPPTPTCIGPDAPAELATPGPVAPDCGVHDGSGRRPSSHSSWPIPARISHGSL
jgi:GNAT superfamily N-acetyltransferase